MADLKQIVSRKAENDTKWREQQQAERENTVAMQDAWYHRDHHHPGSLCPVSGNAGGQPDVQRREHRPGHVRPAAGHHLRHP